MLDVYSTKFILQPPVGKLDDPWQIFTYSRSALVAPPWQVEKWRFLRQGFEIKSGGNPNAQDSKKMFVSELSTILLPGWTHVCPIKMNVSRPEAR